MNLSFVELEAFSRQRDRAFGDDEGLRAFQNSLIENPQAGRMIQGTGGARKVRWADPRRGKGKRGGLRVIYLLVEEVKVAALLFVYDKDTATDLTPAEKRTLAAKGEALKREIIEAATGRKPGR